MNDCICIPLNKTAGDPARRIPVHGCPVHDKKDAINSNHYKSHPSGVECITITEHMGFCLGNAIKYIWLADLKNGVEDLKKAAWYINREIEKRKRGGVNER